MDRDPAAPMAGWLGLSPRQERGLLSFFGSLVTTRYSYLILDTVDQMGAASPAAFSSAEHEQLLRYYTVWMLGLLAMLLPVLLPNSPRLMRMAAMAINLLLLVLFYEHD